MDINLFLLFLLITFVLFAILEYRSQRTSGDHPLYDVQKSGHLTESAREKLKNKQFKDALRDTDEALQLEPNSLYLLWLRASIYIEMQEYDFALVDCETILAKDKNYHWAYQLKGIAYLGLEKLGEAKTNFEKALTLKKDFVQAHADLFKIYLLQGNEELLIAEVQKFLKSDSLPKTGMMNLFDYLNDALYKEEKFEEIIFFTTEAIKLEEASQDFLYRQYFYRMRSHYSLKHYPQAITDAEILINLYPDKIHAYQILAHSYFALKDYEQALARYKKVLELDSSQTKMLLNIGAIYQRQSKFEEAIDIFTELLKTSEKPQDIYNNLAWAKTHTRDYMGALADIEKALKLDAEIAHFVDTRGHVNWLLGNYETALADYNQAISLGGKQAVYLSAKANTLLKLDKEAEAIEIWRESQEINPRSSQDLYEEYRFSEPFFESLQELERLSSNS